MNTPDEKTADPAPSTEPALAEGQKLAGVFVLRKEVQAAPGERIWLAHDEILGKDVSLHFVPDALRTDERAMSELRAEIKRNRQLIHPGILRVYDLIEEAGWVAVSMDWFEGESLASLLAKKEGGCFSVPEVTPWLQQACRTLDEVHRVNVVHRNLSPANLFLDAKGKLLVAKFGVSRAIEDALSRQRKKSDGPDTQLAYLSPQQLDGEPPAKLDDIYSLGVTVFQLLTGELPFSGADMLAQIRRAAPPSLSEARSKAGRSGGGIPTAWEKTVAACLGKAPNERPQSAGLVAQQFDLGGKVPEAAPAAVVTAPAPAPKEKEKPAPAAAPTPAALEKTAEAETPTKLDAAKEPAPAEKRREVRKLPVAAPLPEEKAAAEKPAPEEEGDLYRDLYKRRSGAPVGVIAAVVILVGIAASFYFFGGKSSDETASSTPVNATPVAAVKPAPSPEVAKVATPAPATPAVKVATTKASATPGSDDILPNLPRLTDATPAATPTLLASTGALPHDRVDLVQAAHSPDAERLAATHARTPKPTPAASEADHALANASGNAAPVDVPSAQAALDKAQAESAAAEKAYQDVAKKQQTAQTALIEAQKGVDDKVKSIAPILKSVEELEGQRKDREEKVKGADAAAKDARTAAEEAKKVADQKARDAEDAKRALTDWEALNKEKLASRDRADKDLQALKGALVDKQTEAAGTVKASTEADAARQQKLAAVQQATAALEQAKAAAERLAAETARKADEERAKQSSDLEKKLQEMQAQTNLILQQLEKLKHPDGATGGSTPPAPTNSSTAPTFVPPVPPPAPEPAPAATPRSTSPASGPRTDAGAPALPVGGAEPASGNAAAVGPPAGPAAPKADESTLLASLVPPQGLMPTASKGNSASNPAGSTSPTSDKVTFESSLGIKFAPVGDVLFAIWPTRVQDYEVYAKEAGIHSNSWRTPGFKQGPTHPVVNVSWNDAMAFCAWLTARDRKKGILPSGQIYRLPTDLEWSKGVGLPEETGKTPEQRDMGIPDVFPWGTQWPPPNTAGNYTGEETTSEVAIQGFDDGFPWTSPVGSFPANKYGLYDMGGNVWQWCMDYLNLDSKAKVLRGASWYNGALKLSLLSSCRVNALPDATTDNYGFRIVRASESSAKATKK